MNGIKLAVLIVMGVMFLVELALKVVEYRSVNNPVPQNVQDVYDADEYAKWKLYHHDKVRLDLWEGVVVFLVDLVLLGANAYGGFAGLFPKNGFAQVVAVVLLSVIAEVLTLPFDYYDTMVIEERNGFNRTTRGLFFVDAAKELAIGFVLETGLSMLVLGLYLWLGDIAMLISALALTALVLVLSMFSTVFMRIFNHFTPLGEGELRTRLTGLLEKNGYSVKDILVMDASARTSKANAAFTGFGKTKTVILYDNLLRVMSTEEICAVFAHEMGHGLHRDTLRMQVFSTGQLFLLAVCIWVNVRFPAVCQAFGFAEVNYAFAILLAMSAEMALFGPLLSYVGNLLSRRAEYRADAQAVQEGYAEPMISALKKLSRENFGNLAPSPLTVAMTYSHPTVSQRIAAIEVMAGEER